MGVVTWVGIAPRLCTSSFCASVARTIGADADGFGPAGSGLTVAFARALLRAADPELEPQAASATSAERGQHGEPSGRRTNIPTAFPSPPRLSGAAPVDGATPGTRLVRLPLVTVREDRCRTQSC